MPIQNNNSKYFKEFIIGTIISSTGILLTGLSLSTILFFYDNTRNGKSIKDKLNTILNPNNLVVCIMGSVPLIHSLNITQVGNKKITNATKGLVENMLVSFSKSKNRTPLLANNDVTNINNFELQNPVNNINNKVTINTL
ncbi:hypothetical protein [Spiroplasma endosymbiont of Tricholauxania praeusta]|uniref:hypothetical protein n=1 Tax=Spiroplasma endosymbiont of Tricholauxania praeusta TaxID=3066296 RepID=UPI0030CC4248